MPAHILSNNKSLDSYRLSSDNFLKGIYETKNVVLEKNNSWKCYRPLSSKDTVLLPRGPGEAVSQLPWPLSESLSRGFCKSGFKSASGSYKAKYDFS